ncbi:hypothetical protein K491DRAFT_708864 [Lophiostoma macrostomum CBS 122681]|uniref:DUF3669 domain-containing protein n=1 Tax=Lophiostoma macrostomum CBS 122681 TaxID=1314788 RepID=A0A6A6SMC2_9PLEO|nr:hypothetical protein K491DRAFT_708864 [Lophiostoma macrostomum CBS 122681]
MSSDSQIQRRMLNTSEATDASSRSASLALVMQQSLMLEEKLERELEQEVGTSPTDAALQRMLSLKSIVSTTSSFAERQQAAVGKSEKFREIGKGSIGVIFEHPGTTLCYKLALLDNSIKLWNNYRMHTRVQEAFLAARKNLPVEVDVPKMFWFSNENTTEFWNENMDNFPFDETFPKKARDALCMERVLPLPQPLRHNLIDKYCPRDKDKAKAYVPNRDCLVRPLLGRRRRGSGNLAFSLRNFRLHLDQFQELKLNTNDYATAMADAMAVLHCKARIDAMDIEFVVGSAPSEIQRAGKALTSAQIENLPPGKSTFELVNGKDFTRRIHSLWILDFDACQPINLNPTDAIYRSIGKGFCGSVWTLEGNQIDAGTVIKREDGGPGRSITNDYNMHLRVLESMLQHPPSTPLAIPQCYELIQPTDAWWELRLHQLPPGYSACRALISERIPKVPRTISDKIVDLFCAGNAPLCTFVKNNVDDDACLIRPYLGRRRRHQQEKTSTSRFQRFSLRNVPLHIDQMEAVGLDASVYAETMADALALMHWGAKIDANDIEFVLAPPRQGNPLSLPTFQSDYLGSHCMWVLDYDCCNSISLGGAGVEMACIAFFKNDPGTGRSADQNLWELFKRKYLVASSGILGKMGEDAHGLAERLVDRIEQEGLSRR